MATPMRGCLRWPANRNHDSNCNRHSNNPGPTPNPPHPITPAPQRTPPPRHPFPRPRHHADLPTDPSPLADEWRARPQLVRRPLRLLARAAQPRAAEHRGAAVLRQPRPKRRQHGTATVVFHARRRLQAHLGDMALWPRLDLAARLRLVREVSVDVLRAAASRQIRPFIGESAAFCRDDPFGCL